MPSNDILSEFSSSDANVFKREFTQIIKVGSEIDRYYAEAHHTLDTLIPKFEKLIERFNKKYKGIKIKAQKSLEKFKVRIFIKEAGIKEFFGGCASRIPGLKSVGRNNFGQIEIGDAEKFARFLDSLLDKVYLSYSDYENGTSSIAAAVDRKEKAVELLYDSSDVINENSAGFKICAYYALANAFDRKIEINLEALTFGFSNVLDETERREWHDRFKPRMLE